MGRIEGLVWECGYFVHGHVGVTYTPPSAKWGIRCVGGRGCKYGCVACGWWRSQRAPSMGEVRFGSPARRRCARV